MSFTKFQNEKTPFQAIKTRSSKGQKIHIFPNGLTHAFSPKITIFPTFIFYEIQARKMSFTIFQNKKTPFQAIKSRRAKSRKIDIFTKGLTYSLGPKMAIFPTFIFQAIQARKMSFTILYNEKTPLQARKMSFTIFQNKKTAFQGIKSRSSKCRKIDIF